MKEKNKVKQVTKKQINDAKMELFKGLQSKNPLQFYLKIAYGIIGLPLTLCDTSFCVLAHCPGGVVSDEENIESVDGKQYVSFTCTKEMEEYQIINHLIASTGPYICTDPRFEYPVLFQSVRINKTVAAYIFCPGSERGLTPDELDLIEYLSEILAIEMQKNETFEVESGLKYEYFLQELMDGHFHSDEFATKRLTQLDCKPQPYYYVMVFSFDDKDNRHAAGNYYYDQIKSIFPDGIVGVIDSHLTMLLPRKNAHTISEKERKSIDNFLSFNKMRMGVSYYFTSLIMARYHREQAYGIIKNPVGGRRVYEYENEYQNYFFSKIGNEEWLEAQINPDIRKLSLYDKENHTEYIDTLRAFVKSGRNATKASEILHLHKSTFFYRMGKIAELLEVDIYNAKHLFSYEYSFQLIDYLKRSDVAEI